MCVSVTHQTHTSPNENEIEVFVLNTNLVFLAFLYIEEFLKVSAKNKVAPSGNCIHNTNHHWLRSLMLIQICQSVNPCQFQIVRPLQSHALLNLEIIQLKKVKWSMKQSSIKGSSIQHMSGWQSDF